MTKQPTDQAIPAAIYVVTGCSPEDVTPDDALETGAFFRSLMGAKAYVTNDCADYLDQGLGDEELTWHEDEKTGVWTAILGDEELPDMVWRVTLVDLATIND